jgi:hypothetical protein
MTTTFDQHVDLARSTVATPPSPASSGTTLTVQAADGAKFGTGPFWVLVWPANVSPITTNATLLRVTGVTLDTLTLDRSQDKLAARTIIAGDQIIAPMTAEALTKIEQAVNALETTVAGLSGQSAPTEMGLWQSTASAGTYTPVQSRVRYQGHFYLRTAPHTGVEATFDRSKWLDLGPVGRIAALQGVQPYAIGASWNISGTDTNGLNGSAPKLAAYPYQFAGRHQMLALINNSVSGTLSTQILSGQIEGVWTPGSTGLVIMPDFYGNDRNQWGTAGIPTTQEVTRSMWAYLTSQSVQASTSSSFQFGPGWTSGASSTPGSYVDFTFVGDAAWLRVGMVSGSGGTITITNASGATVATKTTGGFQTAFNGVVRITGQGSGTHTLRATLTSGSGSIVGLAVPMVAPPFIIFYQQGDINLGAQVAADMASYIAALMTDPVPQFPTVVPVANDANYNPATMLNYAGGLPPVIANPTHPNQKGASYFADLTDYTMRNQDYAQGLNQLLSPAAYVAPSPPSFISSGATAPAAPTNVTASTATQISVTWTLPTDGGSTLLSQLVQTSPHSANTFTTALTVGPTITSAIIPSGLTGGSSYDVRVIGVNSVGNGTASALSTATAGATPLFKDTFQRTGNLGGSTASEGSSSTTWAMLTADTGQFSVNTGFIKPSAGTASFAAVLDTTVTTHAVTVVMHTTPASTSAGGIMAGIQDQNNAYQLGYRNGATLHYCLFKRVAGTSTLLTGGDTGVTPTAGDVVTLSRNATSGALRVTINGTVILNLTDASLTTGTKVGLLANFPSDPNTSIQEVDAYNTFI